MDTPRLFLLDAYALVFRAYYALIRMPRITSSGMNTSAIFGFVNTLEELLRKERPSHIAVCFDPQGPTFRHEAYEAYKGEREATPEDIKAAIPIIKEIIRAYNIPIIEAPGFEADDVIGTMANLASAEGFTTYMMTPDKDFGQLVSPTVLQYKPAYRGQDFELRGPAEVCARYDIERPEQVTDILALMGDKADNIPGCPGVGEKTASKLVAEFGSVEALIAGTDRLKGSIKKKVEENAEQITFSKFLATIRTDVPLEVAPSDLARQPEDTQKLFELFRQLEFRTLVKRVEERLGLDKPAAQAARQSIQGSLFDDEEAPADAGGQTPMPPVTTDYAAIASAEEMEEFGKQARRCTELAIFTVADSDNDMRAEPEGWAVADAPGRARYLTASLPGAAELVADLYSAAGITIVSADVKRDYVILANMPQTQAVAPSGYFDIRIAHYLLEPEMRHGTEMLASSYLGMHVPDYESVGGKGAKRVPPSRLDKKALLEWACAQADAALRLHTPLREAVEKEGMTPLLLDVELPLAIVLADMERAGVRIDVGALNDAAAQMRNRLAGLEREVFELAGEEFNIGSPAKVGEILFDRMQLDTKAKKTKTGQYSTSEEVLEKIAHLNPIVGKILEHRQLKKLLNTYLTALPASINPATGKIHTTYNQTVTATGRISSSEPNLQNIPVRDQEGRDIRRAFIPDPGHTFLSADYSQIELRLMADFAGDEVMLDAFAYGRDIHATTAAKIYHLSMDQVDETQRRHAKTANFGIIYGISAFGLSSRLGIPRSEAKELIDGYFATFPAVQQYMADSMEQAREQGYVETIMGRRRRLPDINSRNPVVRGYAERNAINAPIQGSAADIIKTAMVRIHDEMKERGMKSRMIMQVHDELNFDVIPEELPAMRELVARRMQEAYTGRVSLTASMGAADNWLDAH